MAQFVVWLNFDGSSYVENRDYRIDKGERMKRLLTALVLVTVPTTAFAKPKTQAYPANCDRVWAAVKLAAIPPHYNFAMLDDAQKKGIISTGSGLTGKRILDITLTGKGDSCSVSVGGAFSGLAHNDKGDLFARIQKELITPAAPKPEEKK